MAEPASEQEHQDRAEAVASVEPERWTVLPQVHQRIHDAAHDNNGQADYDVLAQPAPRHPSNGPDDRRQQRDADDQFHGEEKQDIRQPLR
jgi:hypothetical protein